jgi:hypothetical protein
VSDDGDHDDDEGSVSADSVDALEVDDLHP